MNITVRVRGLDDFQRKLRALGDRAPAACARAVNRAATAARTQLQRDVAADTGLGSRRVASDLSIQQADKNHTSAVIRADNRRIPLIDFPGTKGPFPSHGRGHVTSRFPTSPHQHAFLMARRRGGRGVFARKTAARLPVVELRGPAIAQSAKHHVGSAQARGLEMLQQRLAHEIGYELQQLAEK
jgi:hypothetical protein